MGSFPPWVAIKWAYTALCLNYSAAAFLVGALLRTLLLCTLPDAPPAPAGRA